MSGNVVEVWVEGLCGYRSLSRSYFGWHNPKNQEYIPDRQLWVPAVDGAWSGVDIFDAIWMEDETLACDLILNGPRRIHYILLRHETQEHLKIRHSLYASAVLADQLQTFKALLTRKCPLFPETEKADRELWMLLCNDKNKAFLDAVFEADSSVYDNLFLLIAAEYEAVRLAFVDYHSHNNDVLDNVTDRMCPSRPSSRR